MEEGITGDKDRDYQVVICAITGCGEMVSGKMQEETKVNDRKRLEWTSERRNIADLIPAEYNPRQATIEEVKHLTASLDNFNLADPIIINKNNRIIGGHFRLKILRDKKITSVDVRVPNRELTLEEEQELNLRLNKNLGQWDFNLLANFDEGMLKKVGFDSQEINKTFQLDNKFLDKQIFQVIITCADEEQLQSTYKKLTDEGYECQLSIL